MMKILNLKEKDKQDIIAISKELKEWFNEKGRKDLKIDLNVDPAIVIKEKNKVIGFLIYASENGIMKIIWLGVKRIYQNKGAGKMMVKWIEDKAKKLGLKAIEVETLTDKEDYEPYEKTRKFYYKHGFNKIAYLMPRFKGWDREILLRKEIQK